MSRDRSVLARVLGYLGMLVTVAMVAVPLYFIVMTALKERKDIYTKPVQWVPDPVTLDSFHTVLTDVPFVHYLANSLVITIALTIIKVSLGIVAAYALSLLRFPGRNLVFVIVVSALMVPGEITVISNYALVAQLGWRNTFVGIIAPLAGTAFGTYLMRNHFLGLPYEIIEAARMDGTRPLKMLFRVVLPMSWPTVVAFTLITIVNEWNAYLWPFLMADDERVAPLPVGLTLLQNNEGLTNWGPVMAGTVLTMLPILLVFLVLQKQMIKGLTSGAVKG